MGNGDMEFLSGDGYNSKSERMSRGNSEQNIHLKSLPHSRVMHKRIEDLANGFRKLDRITDGIDHDIEAFETVTKRIRTGFDNIQLDIRAMREEMFDLFDRLDAMEDGMKARMKGKVPTIDVLGRRSLMGSRQMINYSSNSDLRGSNYSIDRGMRGPASTPPSRKSKTSVNSQDYIPSSSPASNARMSPAWSLDKLNSEGSGREMRKHTKDFYDPGEECQDKYTVAKHQDEEDCSYAELFEDEEPGERYDNNENEDENKYEEKKARNGKNKRSGVRNGDRLEDNLLEDNMLEGDLLEDERHGDAHVRGKEDIDEDKFIEDENKCMENQLQAKITENEAECEDDGLLGSKLINGNHCDESEPKALLNGSAKRGDNYMEGDNDYYSDERYLSGSDSQKGDFDDYEDDEECFEVDNNKDDNYDYSSDEDSYEDGYYENNRSSDNH